MMGLHASLTRCDAWHVALAKALACALQTLGGWRSRLTTWKRWSHLTRDLSHFIMAKDSSW